MMLLMNGLATTAMVSWAILSCAAPVCALRRDARERTRLRFLALDVSLCVCVRCRAPAPRAGPACVHRVRRSDCAHSLCVICTTPSFSPPTV